MKAIRYHLKNLPAHVRGLSVRGMQMLGTLTGVPVMASELSLVLHRADGSVLDLGVVSRRLVTTAGVNYLASTFLNTAEPENFNYHACGTGVTAENITDTAMGTDSGVTRVAGTQTNPSSNIYQTVATMAFVSTKAITEHGVFSASTAGTLLDRSVFTAVNVVSGDSITFTYALTLTAGG
ncbi:MAG: hypothetical protein ABI119_06000 [Gemmatimonadaceae bacterium]